MAYDIEDLNPYTKIVSIQIPNDEVDKNVIKKLRRLQKTVKLQGFRKGKVPISVLKQRYGGSAYQEVLDESLRRETDQFLQEHNNVLYVGAHDVSRSEESITSKFEVEVVPKLDIYGYLGLELTMPKLDEDQEERENMINMIVEQRREEFSTLHPIEDRKIIEPGDTVVFDAKPLSKTVEIPDQELTFSQHTLTIPKDEENHDSLESAFVGCSSDETITAVVKISDCNVSGDYPSDESCTLEISVHSINEKVLPELDDDFAAKNGNFKTYDEFLQYLNDHLSNEKEKYVNGLIEDKIRMELYKRFKFELPPNFLKSEVDKEIRRQLNQMGFPDAFNPELNLETIIPDIDETRKMLGDALEKDIVVNIILSEIGKLENITVDQSDFDSFRERKDVAMELESIIRSQASNEAKQSAIAQFIVKTKIFDTLRKEAEIRELDKEAYEQHLKDEGLIDDSTTAETSSEEE